MNKLEKKFVERFVELERKRKKWRDSKKRLDKEFKKIEALELRIVHQAFKTDLELKVPEIRLKAFEIARQLGLTDPRSLRA